MPFKKQVLFILIYFCGSMVFSQDMDSKNDIHKFAIQFGISDLIRLNGINGDMISAKYDFNENHALSFGISGYVNYNQTSGDDSEDDIDGQISEIKNEDSTYDENSCSISITELFYLTHKRPAIFYIGIGVNIFYIGKYLRKVETNLDSENIENTNRDEITIGGGPKIILGTEWKFSQRFALFAEYSIFTYYAYHKNYQDNWISDGYELDGYKSERAIKEFTIQPLNIALGMSIYL